MNEIEKYNSSIGNLIEPESIGYSFNTPGWHLVFGLLILAALIFAVLRYRKYRRNAYRREAVKKIEEIILDKTKSAVFEINTLLKTLAIGLFGRKNVAALHGREWFDFLVSTTKKAETVQKENFNEYEKAIYNEGYQLNEQQMNMFTDFAVLWIKKHRVTND
ncbi:MAG: DUF4381 domain-containing protein [Bacteroidota bacterium]